MKTLKMRVETVRFSAKISENINEMVEKHPDLYPNRAQFVRSACVKLYNLLKKEELEQKKAEILAKNPQKIEENHQKSSKNDEKIQVFDEKPQKIEENHQKKAEISEKSIRSYQEIDKYVDKELKKLDQKGREDYYYTKYQDREAYEKNQKAVDKFLKNLKEGGKQ